MKYYRELVVWQKSMRLVDETYQLIRLLPKEEQYALCAQMRRAVVSIPSNIAEGNGRNTTSEYIHFLYISRGSLYELETQISICISQTYFSRETAGKAIALCKEIGKMLNSVIAIMIEQNN